MESPDSGATPAQQDQQSTPTDQTTSTPLESTSSLSDVREEQGDPIGASILDRRRIAADGSARAGVADAMRMQESMQQQVDQAMVPARAMPDDALRLSCLQYAKGNLDAAKRIYDSIVEVVGPITEDGGVPMRGVPTDVLLQNAWGAVDGDVDAWQLAANWLLSKPGV